MSLFACKIDISLAAIPNTVGYESALSGVDSAISGIRGHRHRNVWLLANGYPSSSFDFDAIIDTLTNLRSRMPVNYDHMDGRTWREWLAQELASSRKAIAAYKAAA